MALWHGTNIFRKKRKYELGREQRFITIGKEKNQPFRVRGGATKCRVLRCEYANIKTPEGMKKAKLISVIENAANPHYIRRNILTKGAVVKTDIGNVKITSRPGQHGTINGILL